MTGRSEAPRRGSSTSTILPTTTGWRSTNSLLSRTNTSAAPTSCCSSTAYRSGCIELKNPADEDATIWTAWQQLQTYKAELPALFAFNAALVVSDGVEARIGTLTAGWEWFKPWRMISGETLADPHMPQLQVMLEGVCTPHRFLALIREFLVFEDDGSGALVKKMAGYHQFHAVEVAVAETLRAAELRDLAAADVLDKSDRNPGGAPGDRRIGVVWHTQGSGKSLTMAFYAGAIIREPAMANPTIVVLTDRNDLDDQLFGTFSRCQDLFAPAPGTRQQAGRICVTSSLWRPAAWCSPPSRSSSPRTRAILTRPFPNATNIVVIADEAHRSQYDFIDGFARHMRDALHTCLVRRLHRHAHRAAGRQHPRRVRRLHQYLRHPACRRG